MHFSSSGTETHPEKAFHPKEIRRRGAALNVADKLSLDESRQDVPGCSRRIRQVEITIDGLLKTAEL